MDSERKLKAGTTILFGVPADPMPEIIADAIGQAVAQVHGIVEAYLPQCYIPGDEEANQVLVLGVESKEQIPQIMQDLMIKMEQVMPPNQFVDMLPFPTDSLPPGARIEECRVLGGGKAIEEPSPWWKFW